MTILKNLLMTFTALLILFACTDKDDDNDSNNPPCESNYELDLGNDLVLEDASSFPVTLVANDGAASYQWSTGETTNEISVSTAGIFWVNAMDECGDIHSDTIHITINSPCVSTYALDLGNDIVFEDSASFPVTLVANDGAASYLWSTGETTNEISVSTTGMFWVNATDECGDIHSDTIEIIINYSTILIQTDFGDIRIWLYDQTPLHKANFLGLTNDQYYDEVIFHRVVQNFVIQGGDPEGTGFGGPGYTIPAEIIPGLNHVYGAVGAARLPDNVNPDKESHGSQFYIVCDQGGEPGLNGNYTVFGIVFEGLDVVMDISQVPVDNNDKPIEDVVMNHVTVEFFTEEQLSDQFGFEIPL